ncbi:hypothetical protein D1BOALGB6SA_4597 [Olavius sp. associated proteobacterium Delta 1]|nr:hypothetical protein D1BOALGB6SA_4597 [Olavius sp. associated proteobacterium Delta 1]
MLLKIPAINLVYETSHELARIFTKFYFLIISCPDDDFNDYS